LAGRFTSRAATAYLGVIAFFVTFSIMGIWHGSTWVFVVYGLLMGAGASLNKLWQVLLTKKLGRQRYRALSERVGFSYACRGLTSAYFALGLTCLWADMPELRAVAAELGALGLGATYLALAAGAGALFFIGDSVAERLRPLRVGVEGAFDTVVARNLGLAFVVLLIASVTSFFHKAPEFVYRAF
jgi:hypothetical protein